MIYLDKAGKRVLSEFERLQRKAMFHVYPGICLVLVGIVLISDSFTGLYSDLRNIEILGAQFAVLLIIVGLFLMIRGAIIDSNAYRNTRGRRW